MAVSVNLTAEEAAYFMPLMNKVREAVSEPPVVNKGTSYSSVVNEW